MKQKLILIIILIMLILFGIFTYNVDKKRIEEKKDNCQIVCVDTK